MTTWPHTPAERAYADLAFTAVAWAGLEAAVVTGLRRPHRLSDERRAALDALARAEWLERDGLAPGAHRDAADGDVLDLMATVVAVADNLAEMADPDGWPGPASSGLADPRPYLWAVRTCLADLQDADPGVFAEVCDQAWRLARDLAGALGVVRTGWPLPRALCPWCGGRTLRRPTGGAATLVVRVLPGGEPAVVCYGTNCSPPSAHCGKWWRGQPCWPQYEWSWLADWIDAAMAKAS